MTTRYMTTCSITLMLSGVPTLAIGSLVIIIPNSRNLAPGSFNLEQMRSMLLRIYLIYKTIGHARISKAVGTLIVPVWKSAHFWPALCCNGLQWNEFIKGYSVLLNFAKLFLKCKAKNSIFGSKELKFETVALRNSIDVCVLVSL